VTPEGVVTRYDVGAARKRQLGAIGAGADGNVWLVASRDDYWQPRPRMLRITPAGVVTPFSLGTDPDVHIAGLTAGLDGNVWFAEGHASQVAPEPAGIAAVTSSGKVTEFSTGRYFYSPRGITRGPDGALWMTDWGGDNIVRVNSAGELTASFHIAEKSSPWGIVTGSDGNLWFTESGSDRVARITLSGDVSEFSVGHPPTEIVAGPDGRLWFVQDRSASIGRVTTSGSLDQLPVPLEVQHIAVGPDENVYATGTRTYGAFALGGLIRISPAGAVTQIPTGPCSYPETIAAGADGNVWFVDGNVDGCRPIGIGFGRRGRIDKRGVARIAVVCSGGNITVPCKGIEFKLTAAMSYSARGPHGRRVLRRKTMTLGTAHMTLGGPPTLLGRQGIAKVRLRPIGRRLLAKSRSGVLRVRGQLTFGGATKRGPLVLTGSKSSRVTRDAS
jgi:virginiamycin B lyase